MRAHVPCTCVHVHVYALACARARTIIHSFIHAEEIATQDRIAGVWTEEEMTWVVEADGHRNAQE